MRDVGQTSHACLVWITFITVCTQRLGGRRALEHSFFQPCTSTLVSFAGVVFSRSHWNLTEHVVVPLKKIPQRPIHPTIQPYVSHTHTYTLSVSPCERKPIGKCAAIKCLLSFDMCSSDVGCASCVGTRVKLRILCSVSTVPTSLHVYTTDYSFSLMCPGACVICRSVSSSRLSCGLMRTI